MSEQLYQAHAEIDRLKAEIERLRAALTNPNADIIVDLVADMAGNELCWDADEDTLLQVLRRYAEAAGVIEQSRPPA